ncbi:MAG: tannase/feruloyl esterase family alpha/beta hydrolase [Caldilineaceae bacterium]
MGTLDANHGGDAGDFVRLFVVPGMNHCVPPSLTDQFDALTALMNWVEGGQAPDQLIATVNPLNPELPAAWSKTRTRPLCVWPAIAEFPKRVLIWRRGRKFWMFSTVTFAIADANQLPIYPSISTSLDRFRLATSRCLVGAIAHARPGFVQHPLIAQLCLTIGLR